MTSRVEGRDRWRSLDPQVAAAMEPLTALAVGLSPPSVGDVATRRMTMEAGQVFMESKRDANGRQDGRF